MQTILEYRNSENFKSQNKKMEVETDDNDEEK